MKSKIQKLIIMNCFIISSCAQNKMVNLMIYPNFNNPKEFYTDLISQITNLNLTDSIQVIGMPIKENGIMIKIDTSRVLRMGLYPNDIKDQVPSTDTLRNMDQLKDYFINTKSGIKIPLSAIATFHYILKLYKPEIFLPYPEQLEFKGRNAICVKIYCKPNKSEILMNYLENKILKFPVNGIKIEYEFNN